MNKSAWFFREIDSHRRRAFSLALAIRCQLQQSNGTRAANNAFTAILLWHARGLALRPASCETDFYQIARCETGTIDLKLFSIGRYTLINAAASNRELFVTD